MPGGNCGNLMELEGISGPERKQALKESINKTIIILGNKLFIRIIPEDLFLIEFI
jgi:hypothetical protein